MFVLRMINEPTKRPRHAAYDPNITVETVTPPHLIILLLYH